MLHERPDRKGKKSSTLILTGESRYQAEGTSLICYICCPTLPHLIKQIREYSLLTVVVSVFLPLQQPAEATCKHD